MRAFCIFFVCCVCALTAKTEDLTSYLKGIVLVEEQKTENDFVFDESGIWIDSHFESDELALREILSFAIGKEVNQELLQELQSAVEDYYTNERHALVSVVIPEQDVTDCVVQVVVVEARVDCVYVRGNCWTSDRFLLERTHLMRNECVELKQLESDVAWINRSPFRRTDVLLKPGETRGATTVELLTNERFPFRPYVGGDNTGTSYTKQTRWFTGFYAGNIWSMDHQASYQFTTTSEPEVFAAHSAGYIWPFPWHHQLNLYGGWSRVKGSTGVTNLRNKGVYWQVSARYEIPINPIYGNFLQQLAFGYDFKRTNNGLIFESRAISNSYADINQFMVGYYLDYQKGDYQTSFNVEVFFAPARMTRYQKDRDYDEIRPYAKDRYMYARARLSQMFHWRGFSARTNLVGQGTGWNLMPSEQYGIGGYDTVRGYEERAFNADNAFLASLELTTPSTRLFDWRKCGAKNENFYFLAFIDYGWGNLHKPFPGQKSPEWLLGVGPGVRYSWKSNVFFRGDLGFPLHKTGVGRRGIHFHVGGTVSF